MVDSM